MGIGCVYIAQPADKNASMFAGGMGREYLDVCCVQIS